MHSDPCFRHDPEFRSSSHPLPADHRRLLAAYCQSREAAMALTLAQASRANPGAATLKALQALVLASLNAERSALDDLGSAARWARESFLQDWGDGTIIEGADRRHAWEGIFSAEPTAKQDFCWHETIVQAPHGLSWQRYSGGIGLSGAVEYADMPASIFDASALSWFGLENTGRRPSPSGLYRSAPWIDLRGTVAGFQGLFHPIIACGAKSCLCRLVLRQTIFEIDSGAGNHALVILGESTAEKDVLTLQNRYGGQCTTRQMPGAMAMPPVLFRPTAHRATYAALDIRFRIELEGDAAIRMGADPQRTVLLCLFPWRPDPVF